MIKIGFLGLLIVGFAALIAGAAGIYGIKKSNARDRRPVLDKSITSRFDILGNGIKIHSLTAGKKDLPPLILLHGYPANSYLWRHCMGTLSKQFRVYAPDLPGFGRSDKPLDVSYDLVFFEEFLLEYYAALDIKKAHLAVHDLGGMIGLGFAAHNPRLVDKFIVMNTLPDKNFPKEMQDFYGFVRSPFFSKILRFKPVFSYSFFGDKTIVYNKETIKSDSIEEYHSQWSKNRTDKMAFSKVLGAPADKITASVEDLKTITLPTLILWAENDYAMDTGLARQLAGIIPGAELRFIPECGHFSPEEKPSEVSAYMLDFLSGD